MGQTDPQNADFAGSPEQFERELQEGQRMLPAVHRAEVVAANGGASMPAALFKEVLDGEVAKLKALYDALRSMLIANVDYGLIHRKYWDGKSFYTNRNTGRQCRSYHSCSRETQAVTLDKDGLPLACPECGAKPSCWKGGAEKVLRFLRLSPTYELDTQTVAQLAAAGLKGWLPYICRAVRETGEVAGEGRGAASVEKNDGDVNKAIKMAKKSALIDCALSFGLSSVFTQDIETSADYGKQHEVGESEASARAEQKAPASKLTHKKPAPTMPTDLPPDISLLQLGEEEPEEGKHYCARIKSVQPESDWWPEGDSSRVWQEGMGERGMKLLAVEGLLNGRWAQELATTSNPHKHGWGKGDLVTFRLDALSRWLDVRRKGTHIKPDGKRLKGKPHIISDVRLASEWKGAGAPTKSSDDEADSLRRRPDDPNIIEPAPPASAATPAPEPEPPPPPAPPAETIRSLRDECAALHRELVETHGVDGAEIVKGYEEDFKVKSPYGAATIEKLRSMREWLRTWKSNCVNAHADELFPDAEDAHEAEPKF